MPDDYILDTDVLINIDGDRLPREAFTATANSWYITAVQIAEFIHTAEGERLECRKKLLEELDVTVLDVESGPYSGIYGRSYGTTDDTYDVIFVERGADDVVMDSLLFEVAVSKNITLITSDGPLRRDAPDEYAYLVQSAEEYLNG